MHVSAKLGATGSVISKLGQSGSLRALFPRDDTTRLQAVLINTAGGVTGGDEFSVSATAEPNAHLTMTTQACERAYKSQPGEIGQLRNRLHVSAGAQLDWLPQETIVFNGCTVRRTTQISLATDARLLFVEPIIFGRAAMGETITDARFHDQLDIRRDGAPLFSDALAFSGNVYAHLSRPNIAGGAQAMASLIYIAPNAERWLKPLRAMLPVTAGISLLADDLLFLRILAPDGFDLRQSLVPILNSLSSNTLPRPWIL